MAAAAPKAPEMLTQLVGWIQKLKVGEMPTSAIYAGGGGAILGAGGAALADGGGTKSEKVLKMHQALNNSNTNEDTAIDNFLNRTASEKELTKKAYDIPSGLAYGAAALLPVILGTNAIKNAVGKKGLKQDQQEIQSLRDIVDSDYRQDMLSAYGVDEATLANATTQLKQDALGKEGMEKTSAISNGALTALMGSLGLVGGISSYGATKANDPDNKRYSDYKKRLQTLQMSQASTPTISGLPLKDEELIALEMLQKNKKYGQLSEIEEVDSEDAILGDKEEALDTAMDAPAEELPTEEAIAPSGDIDTTSEDLTKKQVDDPELENLLASL